MSLITGNENAREIDFCLGLSTQFGYFTSSVCCEVDEIFFYDIESSDEIVFDPYSISVEEHICFINTTHHESIDFQDSNNNDQQNCSIVIYDESKEEFEEHFEIFQLHNCFDFPCPVDLNPTIFQNKSILNGTSIICSESGYAGIITKSKLGLH